MLPDHLMNQECTIYGRNGSDVHGKAVHTTGETIKCRFQDKHRVRKTASGEDLVLVGVVYIQASKNAVTGNKLVFDGSDYKIESVSGAVAGDGSKNHKKLEVSQWHT